MRKVIEIIAKMAINKIVEYVIEYRRPCGKQMIRSSYTPH